MSYLGRWVHKSKDQWLVEECLSLRGLWNWKYLPSAPWTINLSSCHQKVWPYVLVTNQQLKSPWSQGRWEVYSGIKVWVAKSNNLETAVGQPPLFFSTKRVVLGWPQVCMSLQPVPGCAILWEPRWIRLSFEVENTDCNHWHIMRSKNCWLTSLVDRHM